MVNYFAYGSNMNWDDLDKWCEKKGYFPIDPGSSTQSGIIKGYRLIFNHWSKSRGGGALNIIKSKKDEVCGVFFTLSDEDFQKIKVKEGSAYKPYPVNIFLKSGRVVGAKTFKAKDSLELYPPTDDYLKIVLGGADYFDLGEKCLERIKKAAQQTKTTKASIAG